MHPSAGVKRPNRLSPNLHQGKSQWNSTMKTAPPKEIESTLALNDLMRSVTRSALATSHPLLPRQAIVEVTHITVKPPAAEDHDD